MFGDTYSQIGGVNKSHAFLYEVITPVSVRFVGKKSNIWSSPAIPKQNEIIMLYRVTVKNSKITSGIRLERGMSVDVVTNSMSNPVTTNGGQPVVDAFMRIYGIDIRKAGALSMAWLDVERIG